MLSQYVERLNAEQLYSVNLFPIVIGKGGKLKLFELMLVNFQFCEN